MEKRKEYHLVEVDANYDFKELGIFDSLESINKITMNYNTAYDFKSKLFNDGILTDLDSIIGIVSYDGNRAIPYHVKYRKNTKHSCKRPGRSSLILRRDEEMRERVEKVLRRLPKSYEGFNKTHIEECDPTSEGWYFI